MARILFWILIFIGIDTLAHADSSRAKEYCRPYSQTLGYGPGSVNMCSTPADRYAEMIVPPDLQEFGLASIPPRAQLTLQEQVNYGPQFKVIREQMADSCCGTDRECNRAMREVPIWWCELNKSSKQNNPCSNGARYQLSDPDRQVIMWQAQTQYQRARNIPATLNQKLNDLFENYFNSDADKISAYLLWKISFKSFPRTGEVVMSPKILPGFAVNDLMLGTFRHEMAHACDFIKAQQMALNTNADWQSAYLGAARLVHGSAKQNYCRLESEITLYYQNLFSSYGVGPNFMTCIGQVFKEISTKEHPMFCKSRCLGAMAVETFGKALELISSAQVATPTFWHSACNSAQDGYHLGSTEVLQCLIDHAPHLIPKKFL